MEVEGIVLTRIACEQSLGATPTASYYLLIPNDLIDEFDASAVLIVLNKNPIYSQIILVAKDQNPYNNGKYKREYSKGEDEIKHLTNIKNIIEYIKENGIVISDDLTFLTNNFNSHNSEELVGFVSSLKYTSRLSESDQSKISIQTEYFNKSNRYIIRRIKEQEEQRIKCLNEQKKIDEQHRLEEEMKLEEQKKKAQEFFDKLLKDTTTQSTKNKEFVVEGITLDNTKETIEFNVHVLRRGSYSIPNPITIILPLNNNSGLNINNVYFRMDIGRVGIIETNIIDLFNFRYNNSISNNIKGLLLDIFNGVGSTGNLHIGGNCTELKIKSSDGIIPYQNDSNLLDKIKSLQSILEAKYPSFPFLNLFKNISNNPTNLQTQENNNIQTNSNKQEEIRNMLIVPYSVLKTESGKGNNLNIESVVLIINDPDEIMLKVNFNGPQINSSPYFGESRMFSIEFPLGRNELNTEDISIYINGYPSMRLSTINDSVLLGAIKDYLDVIISHDIGNTQYSIGAYCGGSNIGSPSELPNDLKKSIIELLKTNSGMPFLGEVLTKTSAEVSKDNEIYGDNNSQESAIEDLAYRLLNSKYRGILETICFDDVRKYIKSLNDNPSTQANDIKLPYNLKLNAVIAIRRFLTQNLVNFRSTTENTLVLPNVPLELCSLDLGRSPLDYQTIYEEVSRSLSITGTDGQSDIKISTDGKFNNIEISEFGLTISQVRRLNEKKEKIESTNFMPTFKISVVEQDKNGKTQKYNIYRVEYPSRKQAVLVQCESSQIPIIYDIENFKDPNFSVTRKPVIYFYTDKKQGLNVNIGLDFKGKIGDTYPLINNKNEWNIHVAKNGTLTNKGKEYKYIFWDGFNNPVNWDLSCGFSVHSKDVYDFLERRTKEFGLNSSESQDFITYWGPIIKKNEWSLVAFQGMKYEKLAKLNINPIPDVLIRVFIVFKKTQGKVEIEEQKIKRISRKGFTVVEWGGCNIDETSYDFGLANNELLVNSESRENIHLC